MTLRLRLAVAFAAMAAVVALLMGALGYIATANRIQQEVDDSLLAAAQRILGGPPSFDDSRGPGWDSDDSRSPGSGFDHSRSPGSGFDDDHGEGEAAFGDAGGPAAPNRGPAAIRPTAAAAGPIATVTVDDDDPVPPLPQLRGEEGLAVTAVAADGRYAVVRSDGGVELTPTGPDRAIAASSEPRYRAHTEEVGDTPYRVVTATDGNGRLAVLVGRDWSAEQAVLRPLAAIMALLALALAAAAALAGWWLARRIAARLEQLTATAEQVSDTGQLDVPVPGSGSDEVGRLAAAFNAMLGRLAQSRADQQRLVQDAGHELRTPLTSMRTNISLLQRFEELSPEVRQRVLADLRGESRELSQLVNELLDAASGGGEDGDPEPVVLADVVDRVVARAARKTDRRIEVDCDDTVVLGRFGPLERAVWNLVDNAAKFDPAGSPITVTVAAGELSVADRGPGIPAPERDHIFDRFYRPVSSRSLPGSGLGLAIVRDVVAAHGAQVDCEDRTGGGTVFRIRFPASDGRSRSPGS